MSDIIDKQQALQQMLKDAIDEGNYKQVNKLVCNGAKITKEILAFSYTTKHVEVIKYLIVNRLFNLGANIKS